MGRREPEFDLIVKIGGGLLSHPDCLDAVLREVAEAARRQSLLIVPGGGPFADAVRDVDRRIGLSKDDAHWMAILAMDQYAYVLASRLPGALAISEQEARRALAAHRTPVLAPYAWLRSADPLPHSWDVTSDSIAAWVAGALGVTRLVLVKPPGASGERVVDAFFDRALPCGVTAEPVGADRTLALRAALRPAYA